MSFKLSFSVTDLPLFSSTKDYFRLARELKVEGVELVLGYKTYFSFDRLKELSKEYKIPILSIHQPVAFFLKSKRDEHAFKVAQFFHATYVAHPIYGVSLDHEKAKEFFLWLKTMQEKYKIKILLENMPKTWGIGLMRTLIKSDESLANLTKLSKVCQQYGIGFTLDTTHLANKKPMKENGYSEVYPYMQNIHLSDFKNGATHLPLGQGDLKLKSFIKGLLQQNYNGLVTLEVFGDIGFDSINGKTKQFQNIRESIQMIRKYLN